MTDMPGITDEIKALVDDVLERRLDAAGRDKLAQLLLKDEAVRSYYVQMMQQHASLHWYLKAASREEIKAEDKAERIGALQALAKIAEYERSQPVKLEAVAAEATRGHRGVVRRIRPWLVAAAALLLVTGLVITFAVLAPSAAINPSEPVAVISRSHDAMWMDSEGEFTSKQPGTRLAPGDLELVDGEAELTFDDGAIVVLDAHQESTRLRIDSRSQVSFKQGRMTARMKPDSRSVFTVNSPTLRVTQQAAEFGMFIRPSGAGELHVFRGSVTALATQAKDQARARSVVAMNQAVQFQADGTTLENIKAITQSFANELRPEEDLAAVEQRDPVEPVPPLQAADSLLTAISSTTGSTCSIHPRLADGALAYTDRIHKWRDIPDALKGAQYARLTNNDRTRAGNRIKLTVSRPAVIYVLWNPNAPAQDWLVKDFRDTGVTIGLDRIDKPGADPVLFLRYQIWRRQVPAGDCELGPFEVIKAGLPGIAVVDAAKAGL